MFLCVEYIYDVIKVWRWKDIKCIFHCSRRYYPNFCKLSVSLYSVYDMSLCLDILVMTSCLCLDILFVTSGLCLDILTSCLSVFE